MNSLHIIGNLTRDPETRTTTSGSTVCSFTVAVNRKRTQSNQQPEADYFRVSAWNKLGENCSKYLAKGRKVSVVGAVSVNTYQSQDGKIHASLNAPSASSQEEAPVIDEQSGMMAVEADDLPF